MQGGVRKCAAFLRSVDKNELFVKTSLIYLSGGYIL